MIKEISVKPKPQNNIAKIVFSVTLALSLAAVIIYLSVDKYKGIFGFVAMLILVSAILIYTKYISPVFYYDIMLEGGEIPIFVVRQSVGKRQTTLCRIALSDIASISHETREERRKHKTQKGVMKYNYAPTMFPAEVYRITTAGKYERAEIVIEGTSEFIACLTEYVEEAKKIVIEEEE